MDNQDNMEIVMLHPAFVEFLERFERAERARKAFAEAVESLKEIVRKIVESVANAIAAAFEKVKTAFSDLVAEVNLHIEQDRADRRRWRAAERRFMQQQKATIRQYRQMEKCRQPKTRDFCTFARRGIRKR